MGLTQTGNTSQASEAVCQFGVFTFRFYAVITVINSHALQVSISIANSNSGVWSSSAIGVPALDDSDLRSPIYEISEIAALSALAEELIFMSGRTKVYEW